MRRIRSHTTFRPAYNPGKDIGYVKEVLGGLVLTDDGLRRIAMDK